MLSYVEADARIRRFVADLQVALAGRPAASELVPLTLAAGWVLAEPIHADRDLPPFPRSTRDGYACRAFEAKTHTWLGLAGTVRAGEAAAAALKRNQVWEIMTGAPVPSGADAVFMVEHSEGGPSGVRLTATRTIEAGENIVPRAAEASAGALLVAAGVRIGAAQIAIAAQCGYAELRVLARPRVAILSTGDELVPVECRPGPSQIRNSNSPMLAALVTAAGGEAVILPVAKDEETVVDAAVESILRMQPDLLLITGGISAGRFDLVAGALARVGAEFHFKGVAMQPGKPLVFGELPDRPDYESNGGRIPFFALPGNPLSSAVTFRLFAAPVLSALGGDRDRLPRFGSARLKAGWRGRAGLTRFLPGWCDFEADSEVRLVPWHGSGDIAAFSRANCFVVVPGESDELDHNSKVAILLD